MSQGNPWWGWWIIFLAFVPNITFSIWYLVVRSGRLREFATWKNMHHIKLTRLRSFLSSRQELNPTETIDFTQDMYPILPIDS